MTGRFLDIGANDGKTLSNTYLLSQIGWCGTLVEPSPKAFKRLQALYSGREGFDLIEAAIGTEYGHIDFWESGEHLGNGDVSLLSTVHLHELARWTDESFQKIQVRCIDFDRLMAESMHKNFDLISIDIEGGEKDVVPQIPFRQLGVKMAIIEFTGKDQKFFDSLMFKQGYLLHSKNAENLIYT